MDKCKEHASGKTCFRVIVDGKCMKERCRLFAKVLRMLPKFKRMYELQAQGVILHTTWDFSEKAEKQRLRAKEKAEKWLNEVYPVIVKQLQS